MNVYNRSLFKDRANEARDALREMGGVGNKMPRGILASSPELMQAAMPARQPTAPMQQAQPMPRPASANLPPASPIPDIAGTQAVRQAQPGAVARPPVAQPMMQRPMPQGNPMSGSLQNKPGFEKGGPISLMSQQELRNIAGNSSDAMYTLALEELANRGLDTSAVLQDVGDSAVVPKASGLSMGRTFGEMATEVLDPDRKRVSSDVVRDTKTREVVPVDTSDFLSYGKKLVDQDFGPDVDPALRAAQEKIKQVIKKPPPVEEIQDEIDNLDPNLGKVGSALEVDEALKILAGAELAKAIAGNVTNQQTGEVIRETAGARMAGGAERAAKARLTVEMGREQNELDRQKAESVARIQASAKGKPFLETNEAKLYQERWKSIREATGQNFEKAFSQMAIEMPETHKRWIANVGVDASRQVLDAPASALDFAKKRLSDPKTTEDQKQQVLNRLKELNVEFDETELLGGN